MALNKLLNYTGSDDNFIDKAKSFAGGLFSPTSITKALSGVADFLFPTDGVQDWEGDMMLDDLIKIPESAMLSHLFPADSAIGKIWAGAQDAKKLVSGVTSFASKFGGQIGGMADKLEGFNKAADLGGFIGGAMKSNRYVADAMELLGIMSRPFDQEPLTSFHAMGGNIKEMIQEQGILVDYEASVRTTKSLHFITRPVLESDSGGYYRSYAYFTRPNCNFVFEESGIPTLNPQLKLYYAFSKSVAEDIELSRELCRDSCNLPNLFTFLNNHVKEVSPVRLSDTSREGVKNMHGVQSPLTGSPEYHNVEISVTFMDNSNGDVAKLLYLLSEYKHVIANESYQQHLEYIKYRAIDYYMSLYVFTVNPDYDIISMMSCLYLTLNEPPTHFAQHKMDGFAKNELLDEFSVTFKCITCKPRDPSRYDAFNRISGFNPRCIADTRGVDKVLTIPLLNAHLGAQPWKTSVWDENGGYNRNKTEGATALNTTFKKPTYDPQSYKKRGVLDIAAEYGREFLPNIFGSANDVLNDPMGYDGSAPKSPEFKVNADYMSRGTFEMVCEKPGIYTADYSYGNGQHKRRFRLGFSR